MKKLITILCGVSLSGCGDQQQAAASAKTNEQAAYLVASVNDMPECTTDTQDRLIYAEESNQFFYCKNDTWKAIDIRGKDGKDGKDGLDGQNGVDGADGKDGLAGSNGVDGRDGQNGAPGKDGSNGINGIAGRDGRDGQNGLNGASGADAPYVSDKDWIHPVTGVKWFIAGTVWNYWYSSATDQPQMGDANYLCPVGSHPPSDAEYRDAFKAGLWSKISSITLPVVDGSAIDSVVNQNGVIVKFYRFRYARSTGFTDVVGSNVYPGGALSGTALCVVD